MLILLGIYLWVLIQRPDLRETHVAFWKSIFSRFIPFGLLLKDMNPCPMAPIHSVNAMGLTGGLWRIEGHGDYTTIQPITRNGLNIGFIKKVRESFVSVVKRMIKK